MILLLMRIEVVVPALTTLLATPEESTLRGSEEPSRHLIPPVTTCLLPA